MHSKVREAKYANNGEELTNINKLNHIRLGHWGQNTLWKLLPPSLQSRKMRYRKEICKQCKCMQMCKLGPMSRVFLMLSPLNSSRLREVYVKPTPTAEEAGSLLYLYVLLLFQSPFAQANGCLWNRQELPKDHKWFGSASYVPGEPLPKALRTRRFHPHLPEVTT